MALPLEAINAASAREKSIRRGHPPLAPVGATPASRLLAVLAPSLMIPPAVRRSARQKKLRGRAAALFKIIERLVLWKSTNNEEV